MEQNLNNICKRGINMETYDKIGRKSGNFPIINEEQKEFDEYMKHIHARIMGMI